jgi:hypothetical protein
VERNGGNPQIRDHVKGSYNPFTEQAQIHVDFEPREGSKIQGGTSSQPTAPDSAGKSERADQFMQAIKTIGDNPLISDLLSEAEAAIGPQDKAGKTAVADAKTGKKHAERNEAFYLNLNFKQSDAPRAAGEHKNEDGSSFVVDANGNISRFTTAATLDFPNGLTYSSIRYDKNNEIYSVDTPWGNTLARTTVTDDKGFATWTSTQNGRPVPYVGAAATSWKGECRVDEEGFHSFVLSGLHQNTLYTRSGDGSMVVTQPIKTADAFTGLRTVVTLPDRGRVSIDAEFKKGQAASEHVMQVVDPQSRMMRTIELSALTGNFKITDKQKLTPENPEVKKMADEAREKMLQTRDPVGDITRTLKNIEQLQSATVESVANNGYHIDAHFDTSSTVPAIKLNKRLITPGKTHLDPHISFTLTPSDGGFAITDLHGFRSSITGPLGGVHTTYPTSLFMGRDNHGAFLDVSGFAQLTRRIQINKSLRLRQSNLPAGNPMTEMMDNPGQLKDLSSAMRLFQGNSDVDRLKINRVARGYYDINAVSRSATHIPIDKQIGEHGVSIDSVDIDKDLFVRISQDGQGVRMEHIRGMTVNASSTLVGDLRIQPLKVGIINGADRKPLLEIEVKSPDLNDASVLIEVPATPGSKQPIKSASVKFQVPLRER